MEKYSSLAKLYDGFSFDRPPQEWADYIAQLLEEGGARRGANVADIGCGTGAVTLLLYKKGYRMTAVDASEEMLEVAAQRFAGAGARIQTINQDISKLSLHSGLDAIVMVNDVVNYLTDSDEVKNAFIKTHSLLKDGGVLLFDLSSGFKLKSMDGQSYFEENDDGLYIWHNEYDNKNNTLRMDISIYCHYADDLYEKSLETHVQKAHDVQEVRNMLSDAGFGDIIIYDGFSKDEPQKESMRIQFAAVKKKS